MHLVGTHYVCQLKKIPASAIMFCAMSSNNLSRSLNEISALRFQPFNYLSVTHQGPNILSDL